MNQLFNKIISGELFQEKKKLLIFLIFFISLTVVASYFMINSQKVSAQILPVLVHEEHLAFGTVFPGEELEGNFTVYYVEEYEQEGITYRIIKKRKPLPEEHLEYPDGGDPDMPGFYRNLCTYLTPVSVEAEGDTPDLAYVGSSDSSDAWIIYFKVPAIVGYVAQNHIGGVVASNGEYGCDVSIDIDVEDICDPGEELVVNGGFEEPIVSDGWNIFPSGTSGLGWIVEWRADIPLSWGGYSRPDPAKIELHRGVLGPAQEGFQYTELDSDWDGPGNPLSGEPASVKIYQDIPTIPGLNYNIKFYFSPRPNTDSLNNNLEFSWDGEVKATTTATGGDSISWSGYNYNFTASGTTTRLQFTDLGTADGLGTFLDNVSVKCLLSL